MRLFFALDRPCCPSRFFGTNNRSSETVKTRVVMVTIIIKNNDRRYTDVCGVVPIFNAAWRNTTVAALREASALWRCLIHSCLVGNISVPRNSTLYFLRNTFYRIKTRQKHQRYSATNGDNSNTGILHRTYTGFLIFEYFICVSLYVASDVIT